MSVHRDAVVVERVLRLAQEGRSVPEIHEATGVPVGTIRHWKSGRVPRRYSDRVRVTDRCPHCGGVQHDFEALPQAWYAYLLGIYLGDGFLTKHARGVYALRVSLDTEYPGIVASTSTAIAVVRGRYPHVRPDPTGKRCLMLTSYWKQWRCLIPQHGPGRKHTRSISLREWQSALVRSAPGDFLRGLIHTDGWRGVNRVRVKGRDYAYPRYQFSNRSDDIRRLFTDTCDMLEIAWRPWGRWHISVARREAVSKLDQFVGPKL